MWPKTIFVFIFSPFVRGWWCHWILYFILHIHCNGMPCVPFFRSMSHGSIKSKQTNILVSLERVGPEPDHFSVNKIFKIWCVIISHSFVYFKLIWPDDCVVSCRRFGIHKHKHKHIIISYRLEQAKNSVYSVLSLCRSLVNIHSQRQWANDCYFLFRTIAATRNTFPLRWCWPEAQPDNFINVYVLCVNFVTSDSGHKIAITFLCV